MKAVSFRCMVVTGAVAALFATARAQEAPAPQTTKTLVEQAEALLDRNQAAQAIPLAEKAVQENRQNPYAWFVLARAYQAGGDLDHAIDAGHEAATFAQVRASAYYNLACAYALKGDKNDAFKALTGAKRAGFADRDLMKGDSDLASLRGDARFVLPLQRNYFVLQYADSVQIPFSVDLPVGYDPTRAYPVLLAPGLGKKVEGNWGGLFWGEDTSQRGWIAVECASFMLAEPIKTTIALMDEIQRRYKVEGNKFHIVCYGPTSGPAFAVAMQVPERVKSLTAMPGFPVTDDAAQLGRLKGIRTSFIVGENDAIWMNESRRAYDRLKSLGVECYLEIVPGGNHLLQEMFGGELAERLELLRNG